MVDIDFCISSYLAFRYVARPEVGWRPGIIPAYPDASEQGTIRVRTAEEVSRELRSVVQSALGGEEPGVLLSAGMDSAIIAALLPRGTRAYTIRFDAPGAVDESVGAARVAEALGLRHTIVDVTWQDFTASMDTLMRHKRSPLHPVEVGLYKAAQRAAADGITLLAVGNGADSTFGGMDLLLSKDWTFDEFVERYTFLDPARVAAHPTPVTDIYNPYRVKDGVDVPGFLKRVHGLGIVQMFENAIHAAGCRLVAPFEALVLDTPLDIARIRGGEPKYILRAVFAEICPGLPVAAKIPFARPMDQWLGSWGGPRRPEFRNPFPLAELTGEQKWQVFCLERFLELLDCW